MYGRIVVRSTTFLEWIEHVKPKIFFNVARNFDISIFICYIDCSPRCTLGNRLTNNRAKIVTKGYGR